MRDVARRLLAQPRTQRALEVQTGCSAVMTGNSEQIGAAAGEMLRLLRRLRHAKYALYALQRESWPCLNPDS